MHVTKFVFVLCYIPGVVAWGVRLAFEPTCKDQVFTNSLFVEMINIP